MLKIFKPFIKADNHRKNSIVALHESNILNIEASSVYVKSLREDMGNKLHFNKKINNKLIIFELDSGATRTLNI